MYSAPPISSTVRRLICCWLGSRTFTMDGLDSGKCHSCGSLAWVGSALSLEVCLTNLRICEGVATSANARNGFFQAGFLAQGGTKPGWLRSSANEAVLMRVPIHKQRDFVHPACTRVAFGSQMTELDVGPTDVPPPPHLFNLLTCIQKRTPRGGTKQIRFRSFPFKKRTNYEGNRRQHRFAGAPPLTYRRRLEKLVTNE